MGECNLTGHSGGALKWERLAQVSFTGTTSGFQVQTGVNPKEDFAIIVRKIRITKCAMKSNGASYPPQLFIGSIDEAAWTFEKTNTIVDHAPLEVSNVGYRAKSNGSYYYAGSMSGPSLIPSFQIAYADSVDIRGVCEVWGLRIP